MIYWVTNPMRLSHQLLTGLSFGLTSGVITTLGLMVGLLAGTHSKLVVIGGILTIAVADALSDAFGIHVSEESEGVHSSQEVWASTTFTFLTKFIFALTFIIPIVLFQLSAAVAISVIWGLFLLSIFSFYIAKARSANPWKLVLEHISVTLLVVLVTYCLGSWIARTFG